MDWEAGEVLDAEIDVKVMRNFPRMKTAWGYRTPGGTEYLTMGPVWPRYSSDMTAAWRVAELLRAKGWGVEIFLEPNPQQPDTCRLFGPEARVVEASEPTLPLAICRAALSALESA